MKKVLFLLTIVLIFFLLITPLYCQNVKCRLWKTNDFSKLPDSLKLPSKISCTTCSWDILTGEELNKKGNFIAVHLTFSGLRDTSFSIKSKYKNFSLIKKGSNKATHPFAIVWPGFKYDKKTDKEVSIIGFMTQKLKAINYKAFINPKNKCDMIFMFKEAEVGDIIVIEDFIKAEITE